MASIEVVQLDGTSGTLGARLLKMNAPAAAAGLPLGWTAPPAAPSAAPATSPVGGTKVELASDIAPEPEIAAEAADVAPGVATAQPLRVVCVSDTHGFERGLTDPLTADGEGGCLPAGDVLVHAGDFQIDASVG